MRRARAASFFFAALIPAVAWANGAMGLGLEMFDFGNWLVYVVATVLLEAWIIGSLVRFRWYWCIATSIGANLVTAMLCTNVAAVGMHSTFVGSRVNPAPFSNAFLLLVVFGLLSAVIEAGIWDLAAARSCSRRGLPLFGRVVLAHLIGVPLALAILLIPSRPYVGLEAFTRLPRRSCLSNALSIAIVTDEKGEIIRVPNVDSAEALIRFAQKMPPPESEYRRLPPDAWAAAYLPDFSRFDNGEMRRRPFEWNKAVAGKTFKTEWEGKGPWLLRHSESGRCEGYYLDLSSGRPQMSRDPKELGLAALEKPIKRISAR